MTMAFDNTLADLKQTHAYAQGKTMKNTKAHQVTYAASETADFRENEAVIAEYLTAAAEDSNPEVVRKA